MRSKVAAPFLPKAVEALGRDGYAVLEGVLDRSDLEDLLAAELAGLEESDGRRGGVRGVLAKRPGLHELAKRGAPALLARAVLSAGALPVKATLFDKTAAANWKVPWHQDLSIAVEERQDAEGFGPWTVKDGVQHVQPPVSILEGVLAVRLHLDPADAENGALRVVPGSHLLGRLAPPDIERLRRERGEVVCPVGAGGAMLMAPLLLHASSASLDPARRRVLHLEYSALELPAGLRWASA